MRSCGSILSRKKTFVLSISLRLTWGTPCPYPRATGDSSTGVRRPGSVADQSLACSTEAENMRSYSSMVRNINKHRDSALLLLAPSITMSRNSPFSVIPAKYCSFVSSPNALNQVPSFDRAVLLIRPENYK
jgi:hypothetical protein